MKIKSITLFANNLEAQKSFYRDTLGIELVEESSDDFTVRIGWSTLTFRKSIKKYIYHYCFLIPANKLDEALKWFETRLDIIPIESAFTYFFEDWNAKSFYFYDGDGNVAECIVRYDLDNPSLHPFQISDLLSVNEIGMPNPQIESLNEKLTVEADSHFYKGDMKRFGTNGNQEGLFLLVNNERKKTWFPTDLPTESSPFEATFETKKGMFTISYSFGQLNFS